MSAEPENLVEQKPVIGSYGKRVRWFGLFYLLLAAGQVLRDDGHPPYLIAGLYGLLVVFLLAIPPTRITATGVRPRSLRPWRHPIPFSEVSAVLKPEYSAISKTLRLRLTNGTVVKLPFVTADRAEALAGLAGVPVQSWQRRSSSGG